MPPKKGSQKKPQGSAVKDNKKPKKSTKKTTQSVLSVSMSPVPAEPVVNTPSTMQNIVPILRGINQSSSGVWQPVAQPNTAATIALPPVPDRLPRSSAAVPTSSIRSLWNQEENKSTVEQGNSNVRGGNFELAFGAQQQSEPVRPVSQPLIPRKRTRPEAQQHREEHDGEFIRQPPGANPSVNSNLSARYQNNPFSTKQHLPVPHQPGDNLEVTRQLLEVEVDTDQFFQNEAPAVLSMLDQRSSSFSERNLHLKTRELIMKGWQHTEQADRSQLLQYQIDQLSAIGYANLLKSEASPATQVFLASMNHFDHVSVILSTVKREAYANTDLSVMSEQLITHTPHLTLEMFYQLQQFESHSLEALFSTYLTQLYTSKTVTLKQEHFLLVLALNRPGLVLEVAEKSGFAKANFNWKQWHVAQPTTDRENRSVRQKQQCIHGAFSLRYPKLSGPSLAFILSNQQLACQHDVILEIELMTKNLQGQLASCLETCVLDLPGLQPYLSGFTAVLPLLTNMKPFLATVKTNKLGKCSTSEFKDLLDNILNFATKQIKELCLGAGTLTEVLNRCVKVQKSRAGVASSTASLTKKMKAYLDADRKLKDWYELVTVISKEWEAAGSVFVHKPYQCFQVAQYLSNPAKFKFIRAGPGQGKTFLMLLGAHAVLRKKIGIKTVYILTQCEIVQRQINQAKQDFAASVGQVKCFNMIDYSNVNFENSYVFFDESDMYLPNQMLVFKEERITGFCGIRHLNVCLFSATLTKYWRGAFRDAFGLPDKAFVEVIPQKEFETGIHEEVISMNGQHFPTWLDAINMFKAQVKEHAPRRPILVFGTDKMDEIEAVCMEACSEYGINFRRVKNTNEGMTERENAMALNRGLWLLERSFSRGYDLKLNVDSFVIVCDIGQKLDLTEARQMIGRGSRSQQVSNGFVLHIGPIKPLVGVSIVKILQTKEAVDIDDGGLILKAILRLWDQNNDGDRAALEVAFGAKKWKIHEQGLSGRNSNADIMSKISELLR